MDTVCPLGVVARAVQVRSESTTGWQSEPLGSDHADGPIASPSPPLLGPSFTQPVPSNQPQTPKDATFYDRPLSPSNPAEGRDNRTAPNLPPEAGLTKVDAGPWDVSDTRTSMLPSSEEHQATTASVGGRRTERPARRLQALPAKVFDPPQNADGLTPTAGATRRGWGLQSQRKAERGVAATANPGTPSAINDNGRQQPLLRANWLKRPAAAPAVKDGGSIREAAATRSTGGARSGCNASVAGVSAAEAATRHTRWWHPVAVVEATVFPPVNGAVASRTLPRAGGPRLLPKGMPLRAHRVAMESLRRRGELKSPPTMLRNEAPVKPVVIVRTRKPSLDHPSREHKEQRQHVTPHRPPPSTRHGRQPWWLHSRARRAQRGVVGHSTTWRLGHEATRASAGSSEAPATVQNNAPPPSYSSGLHANVPQVKKSPGAEERSAAAVWWQAGAGEGHSASRRRIKSSKASRVKRPRPRGRGTRRARIHTHAHGSTPLVPVASTQGVVLMGGRAISDTVPPPHGLSHKEWASVVDESLAPLSRGNPGWWRAMAQKHGFNRREIIGLLARFKALVLLGTNPRGIGTHSQPLQHRLK